jgi:hypothetical protein
LQYHYKCYVCCQCTSITRRALDHDTKSSSGSSNDSNHKLSTRAHVATLLRAFAKRHELDTVAEAALLEQFQLIDGITLLKMSSSALLERTLDVEISQLLAEYIDETINHRASPNADFAPQAAQRASISRAVSRQYGLSLSQPETVLQMAKDKKLYCERHYYSSFPTPCGACNKSIQGGSGAMRVGDLQYHQSCLKCSMCSNVLLGNGDVYNHDQTKALLCQNHYISLFGPVCIACTKPIMIATDGVSYQNRPYHRACLKCATCSKLLSTTASTVYGAANDKSVYCEAHYQGALKKCSQCNKICNDAKVCLM